MRIGWLRATHRATSREIHAEGEVFRSLAVQKACRIDEGHVLSDHVHRLMAIPPQYAVAHVIGFLKGRTAMHIARTSMGRRENFTGQHFWARGYSVSTVGREETIIRASMQRPEEEDKRLEQMGLWWSDAALRRLTRQPL